MISPEQLTAPLAGDDPCGADLAAGPQLIELDALVRGKPKTEFRAAIEPDWVAVRKTCVELFEKSRDLRVAVTLARALLYTEGLQGLSEGLAVIQGLLEKHWASVYPKLDPDDHNDPLQRMNTLSIIATPRETLDDPPRSVTPLGEIVLAQSRQFGRYTFDAIVE